MDSFEWELDKIVKSFRLFVTSDEEGTVCSTYSNFLLERSRDQDHVVEIYILRILIAYKLKHTETPKRHGGAIWPVDLGFLRRIQK